MPERRLSALSGQVYGWLLRKLALPLGDRLFGGGLLSRIALIERAQWWDAARVLAHREAELRKLVRTAYEEVPLYRERMQVAGVSPLDVRSIDDLTRLPIQDKEVLRAGYPDRTTRETGHRTFEYRTSGSTGKNFIVRADRQTASFHRASFLLSVGWTGWRPGTPHFQTGMTLERSFEKRLKDTLLRCHYVSAYDLSDETLDRHLQRIEHHRLGYLWGYPGSLYFLARRAAQLGWNQPTEAAVTWGDKLYPRYRDMIEATFHTRVFDTYGCAEGFQVSAQCGMGSHYHVHALDVVVEYVDDEGNPVSADRPGNLLITRLFAGPMPLIRYRVGDVGVRGSGQVCPCGRGFELMRAIEGRDTDVVITPSGNRLIVHYFTGLLEQFDEIDEFQVVQREPSSIVLRLVPHAVTGLRPEVVARVIETLGTHGARDLRIDVEIVPGIPVARTGKRRFVVSEIPV